jgi:hypothetical protein
MFEYLTSDVDWCEDNFVYCDKIAEMWNSITSGFFILFGLFGIYKMPIKTKSVYFFFVNNIFIGLTSILFHSTLSIEGQILDEFSILFHTLNGIIYLEKYHKTHKELSVLTVISMPLLVYVYPIMNRFFLFMMVPYVLYLARKYMNYLKTIDEDIYLLIKYSKKSFYISFVCWIIDYICFMPISSHFIWHIFIAYSCYCLTIILQIISYNRRNLYKNLLHIEFTKYGKIPYLEFNEYQDRYIYY